MRGRLEHERVWITKDTKRREKHERLKVFAGFAFFRDLRGPNTTRNNKEHSHVQTAYIN